MAEPGAPPSGGGGGGGGVPPFLRAKTFGMPRWVFLGLLAGAVATGLYLRSRAAEAAVSEDPVEEAAVPSEEFGATAADLTDLGEQGSPGYLAGGSTGQVIPVTSPMIPEGFPEVFAGLGALSTDLGHALAEQTKAPVTVVNKLPKGSTKKKPAGSTKKPPTHPKPKKPSYGGKKKKK